MKNNNKLICVIRSRRQAITAVSTLGLAAVLPKRWIKPVINAVVLPVHAQTSGDDPDSVETQTQLCAMASSKGIPKPSQKLG